jgi:putative nicotinate phosphoribosyltransferase
MTREPEVRWRRERGSTALLTDQYEFTALRAAIRSGRAFRPTVFEVFARSLPPGRRYGVFCGLGRLLEAVQHFRFDEATVDFLREIGLADEEMARYLTGWRFDGTIDAYREGDLYFPYSPVLRVTANFGDATLLETVVLSILNHDSAIASAAARMVQAAGGRPVVEMGGRRTHELAGPDAARAAYIAGFSATSSLEARRRYGVPSVGTSMHAFTLVHDDEHEAFLAQLGELGVGTTLLVDTYDTAEGIRTAVKAANELGAPGPGGIRVDSGDLRDEVRAARELLDSLGATNTQITLTSDLDEYSIDELADDPVDSFGVGTRLVTGSGAPTAGFVYKQVAKGDGAGGWLPVAKRSKAKASVGLAKTPYRLYDDRGRAVAERFSTTRRVPEGARPLQHRVMLDGEIVDNPSITEVRHHCEESLDELDERARTVEAGDPVLVATLEEA